MSRPRSTPPVVRHEHRQGDRVCNMCGGDRPYHDGCEETCGGYYDDNTMQFEVCKGPCPCECRKGLTPDEVMKLKRLVASFS